MTQQEEQNQRFVKLDNSVNAQSVGVQVIRLNPELRLPDTGSPFIDLQANLDYPITFGTDVYGEDAHYATVPTGLKLKINAPGIMATVVPTIDLCGQGLDLIGSNVVGLIDPSFDQEIEVIIELRPDYPPFTIYPEELIARLVLVPLVYPTVQEVQKFS